MSLIQLRPLLTARSAFPRASSSALRPQSTTLILLTRPAYRTLHSSPTSSLETETHQPSSNAPPPGLPSSAPRRRPASAVSAPAPPPVQARVKERITSPSQLPASFGQNQVIPVAESVREELEGIVKAFKAPVRFAFAYGSGVFRQEGYTDEDAPLLDFVFAVSHPRHWHALNMQQNPHHYSGLMRLLGSDAVAWLQEKGPGAGVWFNLGAQVNGQTIKYGCISIDALCRDMLDWETLYISGRTQKPVRILVDDARVRLSNQANLASALRTALLLLPEAFTERELYECLAGLSYRGDFRMAVGENPLKVKNIVAAQLPQFRKLYGGLVKSFWKTVHTVGETPGGERLMRQERGTSERVKLLRKLPVGLRGKVREKYEADWRRGAALRPAEAAEPEAKDLTDPELVVDHLAGEENKEVAVWSRIVEDAEFDQTLSASLAMIVKRPALNQSIKGIVSAGPVKSLGYVGAKLSKKFFGGGKKTPKAIEDVKEK